MLTHYLISSTKDLNKYTIVGTVSDVPMKFTNPKALL